MRAPCDRQANAAYIHVADQPLQPGHATTRAQPSRGLAAFIALGSRADRHIGIEVPDASLVPADLLDQG